ncbi:branched-chain amino acid ABC transporter ATP-binding protein [Halostagnicola larsenii XH-48]|uniref:Branched-chain amino acid ABC transporter ATP-binding protein n=1 Tax=Halostagnicola larsenii XH-48 TaxID=797299 RepID=W0JKW0_9EURY|nr:ABC transporter ATP-binding protein [Halostagnicola larsenii]AHF99238.1 branched-chain amino acid ABC transporter ATP-binding protein [Halostagnicola larsenii XH-48]
MGVSDPTVKPTPAVDETGEGSSRVLQTRGLTKHFGGLTATDEVDFALEEGELRCLIGPNGAGKSTFINLLTGQLEASAGSIYYDGRDITELSPHERVGRGISMKFQVPSIYEEFTVAQNLRIPLQQVVDADEYGSRTRKILERFDLLAERETTASDLSHGQQQRLEIGMAMAMEPKLMLLDEPVAGLSVEETADIAELFEEITADDGVALIVIEHDIDFVESIADRVTVLDQGSIFREGSIEEIRADSEVKRIYLGDDH